MNAPAWFNATVSCILLTALTRWVSLIIRPFCKLVVLVLMTITPGGYAAQVAEAFENFLPENIFSQFGENGKRLGALWKMAGSIG